MSCCSPNSFNNNILWTVGQGFNLLTATSLACSSRFGNSIGGGRGNYCLSYEKNVVILDYLDPSEFSSHIASAFRCSALSSSALRSSARDIARPRRAGRQSGPGSPLRPAGREGCTEFNHSKIHYSVLFCSVLLYCIVLLIYSIRLSYAKL